MVKFVRTRKIAVYYVWECYTFSGRLWGTSYRPYAVLSLNVPYWSSTTELFRPPCFTMLYCLAGVLRVLLLLAIYRITTESVICCDPWSYLIIPPPFFHIINNLLTCLFCCLLCCLFCIWLCIVDFVHGFQ